MIRKNLEHLYTLILTFLLDLVPKRHFFVRLMQARLVNESPALARLINGPAGEDATTTPISHGLNLGSHGFGYQGRRSLRMCGAAACRVVGTCRALCHGVELRDCYRPFRIRRRLPLTTTFSDIRRIPSSRLHEARRMSLQCRADNGNRGFLDIRVLKMWWKKTFIAATSVIGIAGLVLAGYVLLISAPDVRRYVKISTM